jgi:Tol biopolymer transport system component
MSIQFPTRLGWLLIILITFLLLQNGCTPIQPSSQAQSPLNPEAGDTASSSTEPGSTARESPLLTTIEETSTSPDGEWIATATAQIPDVAEEYTQSLVVEHRSGSPRYEVVKGSFPYGLGYTIMKPLTWSDDNSRFYYGNAGHPDGCALFVGVSDLYELDLATGTTREILANGTATALTFAPNKQLVAYPVTGESTLIVQNIHSGDYASVNLEAILGNDQTGGIVWSPDSNSLAFVIAHEPCNGGWALSTSIYVLDIKTMNVTPHLEKDERLLVPAAWSTPEQLLLENNQGEPYLLDLTTNTLIPPE